MWLGTQLLAQLLVILVLPLALVVGGFRDAVRRLLVPRGAPHRVVTAGTAVAMFTAILAIANSGGGESGDNAWLILLPAVYALGLSGLAFTLATFLWPERWRAGFTSGVILMLLVLGALNIILLGGWALVDEEDLAGEPIRPPVIRVIAAIAGTMVIAVVAGQLQRGPSRRGEPGSPVSGNLTTGHS